MIFNIYNFIIIIIILKFLGILILIFSWQDSRLTITPMLEIPRQSLLTVGNTTVFHGRCSLFHNWKYCKNWNFSYNLIIVIIAILTYDQVICKDSHTHHIKSGSKCNTNSQLQSQFSHGI